MDKIFTTDELHPRDRFAAWHDIACEQICVHRSVPESAATFEAELFAGQLAGLQLFKLRSAPMAVARTPKEIARADTDDIFLCRPFAGRLQLEQDGREVELEPGGLCLLDPLVPYTGHFSGNAGLFVVAVGRRAFEAHIGSVGANSVRPLGIGAMGELISSYVGLLPDCAATAVPHRAAMFEEQLLDLLAETLFDIKDGGKPATSPRAMSAAKIRLVVDQNLSNPALTPSLAAKLAGISVRYANALLSESGTSMYRLIVTQRLDRCQRALQDPAQGHRTVTEIALSWGFTDLPYFSRSFKAAFGMSPRAYRAAALGLPSST